MRYILFCILFLFVCCFTALAQHDSLTAKDKSVLKPVDPKTVNPFLPDSTLKTNRQQFVEDSLAMVYLAPDSAHSNGFIDSMKKTSLDSIFFHAATHSLKTSTARRGNARYTRGAWEIAAVIGLLILTGLLNLFLGNDLKSVFQSFYTKNGLSKTDKESGMVNSRASIGLFLLFCFSAGLFLYQYAGYAHIVYGISGVTLFLSFSAGICLLVALKFLILKFIGFVFDIGGLISEYIAVLNLTYFNLAFVFLGTTICFSLLAGRFIPILFIFVIGLSGIIFAWQYIRNSLNIISDFRFHKFYLFIYLCALEICPVLILIKAIDI